MTTASREDHATVLALFDLIPDMTDRKKLIHVTDLQLKTKDNLSALSPIADPLFIAVYSKPNCPACTATYRNLDRKGLYYQPADITLDAAAADLVIQLGAQEAPVVVLTDQQGRVIGWWSGYRPDLIAVLAAQVTAQKEITEMEVQA